MLEHLTTVEREISLYLFPVAATDSSLLFLLQAARLQPSP